MSRRVTRYRGDFPGATEDLVPGGGYRGVPILTGGKLRAAICNVGEVVPYALILPGASELACAAGMGGSAFRKAGATRGYESNEALLAAVTGLDTYRHDGFVVVLPPAAYQPDTPNGPEAIAKQLIDQSGPEAARAVAQYILTHTQQ